jgi:hypothetical protein
MDAQIDKDQLENYAIVYEGYRPLCRAAIEALDKEGFHSGLLEDPGVQTRYSGMNLFHVMVPKEEKAGAEDFLRKWEQQSRENVKKITAEIPRQLRTSLLWTIPFAVVFYLAGFLFDGFILLVLIWVGILIFIVNKDRIFKRDEPKETDDTNGD